MEQDEEGAKSSIQSNNNKNINENKTKNKKGRMEPSGNYDVKETKQAELEKVRTIAWMYCFIVALFA